MMIKNTGKRKLKQLLIQKNHQRDLLNEEEMTIGTKWSSTQTCLLLFIFFFYVVIEMDPNKNYDELHKQLIPILNRPRHPYYHHYEKLGIFHHYFNSGGHSSSGGGRYSSSSGTYSFFGRHRGPAAEILSSDWDIDKDSSSDKQTSKELIQDEEEEIDAKNQSNEDTTDLGLLSNSDLIHNGEELKDASDEEIPIAKGQKTVNIEHEGSIPTTTSTTDFSAIRDISSFFTMLSVSCAAPSESSEYAIALVRSFSPAILGSSDIGSESDKFDITIPKESQFTTKGKIFGNEITPVEERVLKALIVYFATMRELPQSPFGDTTTTLINKYLSHFKYSPFSPSKGTELVPRGKIMETQPTHHIITVDQFNALVKLMSFITPENLRTVLCSLLGSSLDTVDFNKDFERSMGTPMNEESDGEDEASALYTTNNNRLSDITPDVNVPLTFSSNMVQYMKVSFIESPQTAMTTNSPSVVVTECKTLIKGVIPDTNNDQKKKNKQQKDKASTTNINSISDAITASIIEEGQSGGESPFQIHAESSEAVPLNINERGTCKMVAYATSSSSTPTSNPTPSKTDTTTERRTMIEECAHDWDTAKRVEETIYGARRFPSVSSAFTRHWIPVGKALPTSCIRLFVGQLRKKATEEALMTLLERTMPHITVLRVQSHTNRTTKQGKGCAWLYVATQEDANEVLKLHKRAFFDVITEEERSILEECKCDKEKALGMKDDIGIEKILSRSKKTPLPKCKKTVDISPLLTEVIWFVSPASLLSSCRLSGEECPNNYCHNEVINADDDCQRFFEDFANERYSIPRRPLVLPRCPLVVEQPMSEEKTLTGIIKHAKRKCYNVPSNPPPDYCSSNIYQSNYNYKPNKQQHHADNAVTRPLPYSLQKCTSPVSVSVVKAHCKTNANSNNKEYTIPLQSQHKLHEATTDVNLLLSHHQFVKTPVKAVITDHTTNIHQGAAVTSSRYRHNPYHCLIPITTYIKEYRHESLHSHSHSISKNHNKSNGDYNSNNSVERSLSKGTRYVNEVLLNNNSNNNNNNTRVKIPRSPAVSIYEWNRTSTFSLTASCKTSEYSHTHNMIYSPISSYISSDCDSYSSDEGYLSSSTRATAGDSLNGSFFSDTHTYPFDTNRQENEDNEETRQSLMSQLPYCIRKHNVPTFVHGGSYCSMVCDTPIYKYSQYNNNNNNNNNGVSFPHYQPLAPSQMEYDAYYCDSQQYGTFNARK